jgi:hypothetical protein
MAGSIGSFYFGPQQIDVVVTPDPVQLHSSTNTNSIRNTNGPILPTVISVLTPLIPSTHVYSHISVDFSGSPVVGSSPLLVSFEALPRFSNNFTSEIAYYRWYFDTNDFYEESTSKYISHYFVGNVGRKFDVRLDIVLDTSEIVTLTKIDYISITASSKRNTIGRKINLVTYLPEFFHT